MERVSRIYFSNQTNIHRLCSNYQDYNEYPENVLNKRKFVGTEFIILINTNALVI